MEVYRDPPLEAIRTLLSAVDLPTEDVFEDDTRIFFGLGDRDESTNQSGRGDFRDGDDIGALAGVIGVELYNNVALVRSLAVSPDQRGAGLGSILVAHLERFVMREGVRSLYLLTTTAQPYFARRGYDLLPKENAPEVIRKTREYSVICPESAVLMVKHS